MRDELPPGESDLNPEEDRRISYSCSTPEGVAGLVIKMLGLMQLTTYGFSRENAIAIYQIADSLLCRHAGEPTTAMRFLPRLVLIVSGELRVAVIVTGVTLQTTDFSWLSWVVNRSHIRPKICKRVRCAA